MPFMDFQEVLDHLWHIMRQFPLVQHLACIRTVDAKRNRLFVHIHASKRGSRCERICVVFHRAIPGWPLGERMLM